MEKAEDHNNGGCDPGFIREGVDYLTGGDELTVFLAVLKVQGKCIHSCRGTFVQRAVSDHSNRMAVRCLLSYNPRSCLVQTQANSIRNSEEFPSLSRIRTLRSGDLSLLYLKGA